ncbi:hypothetical protein NDU88_004362 [Pleurodeles waltl]|uniref:Uncharacterized protein n=1 Tax=Pleurodeles waltl TaxID=8319 RepID=A0AAV7LUE6_PLEWA|nr:hypothetical protein NDU88_004362 [Pleurodeles waltl]
MYVSKWGEGAELFFLREDEGGGTFARNRMGLEYRPHQAEHGRHSWPLELKSRREGGAYKKRMGSLCSDPVRLVADRVALGCPK